MKVEQFKLKEKYLKLKCPKLLIVGMLWMAGLVQFVPVLAEAQEAQESSKTAFMMPLDLIQGGSLNQINGVTPWVGTAKLTPELLLENFGFGAQFALRDWGGQSDVGGGLRADYLFLKIAPNLGSRIVVDGDYWLNGSNFSVEAALARDISAAGRISAWWGFYANRNAVFYGLSIGVNLAAFSGS